MKKLRVMECFGGIGACSKALERLGIEYEIADYVEIDKYAVKSFNAMHNTNFDPQDICEWDKDIEVDLIMHRSPCQDFSLAGRQAGGDEGSGTRSSLMYETIRIVEKLKPKYVIWENVKNLLSKKHRHNFDAYLEAMEQLGYTNYYQVLNAKDYGIPQNRERVFTISILGDENYEFPQSENLTKMPIYYLERNIDEKYYLTEKNLGWLKEHNKRHEEKGTGFIFKPKNPNTDVANTIRANASWCPTDNAFFEFPPPQELKLKTEDILEDEVEEKYYLSEKMKVYISKRGTANFRNPDCEINLDIARPLTTDPNKRAGTTNYICKEMPNNFNICDLDLKQHKIRRLTPKECWRLMGFDDEDYEKAAKVNSNTQLYKQAGNSIVVNVLEAILRNLLFNESQEENKGQLSIFDIGA